MKISPLGDSALIIDFADESSGSERLLTRALSAATALERAKIPSVVEVTSSYQSVAIFFDPARIEQDFEEKICALVASAEVRSPRKARRIEIPVCYDDEFALDLARVANQTSLAGDAIIALHSSTKYIVACIGFVPGFPFFAGLSDRLRVPRLESPRTKVPAGSVAIANAQAGIYPFESPGGWNVIGRTPLRLFSVNENPPTLLRPGDRVRFRRITRQEFEKLEESDPGEVTLKISRRDPSTALGMTIIAAGFQSTVQDCGRTGLRKFGVTPGGALDSVSLRLANLLVGNSECLAGLEITSGRMRLKIDSDRLVAWAGGEFEMRIGDNLIPILHCARASAGAMIEISPKRGGRAWLAISGGIDVPEILGSRSTDLRAHFGGWAGRVLRDGDELPLGAESKLCPVMREEISDVVSDWSAPRFVPREGFLRVIRGKGWDDDIGGKLLAQKFVVAMNSDRMGLRLEGGEIVSANPRELVSEAVAPGTIQLPRSGAPVVLLGDCQTIGGYLKIAHVITVDLGYAAQLQPLDQVRFELIELEEAQELLQERERDIALFRAGLEARFG